MAKRPSLGKSSRGTTVFSFFFGGLPHFFRRHPRPNLAQGSWVQRARPQVTGAARPCDRQRLGLDLPTIYLIIKSRIAPPTKRIIFNFAKEVGSPSAVDRTDYGSAAQPPAAPGAARLRPAPLATALARRRLWRRAEHQQRCSQHACRALIFMTGLNAPPPCARAF